MKITQENIAELFANIETGLENTVGPFLFYAHCDNCQFTKRFEDGQCVDCKTIWTPLQEAKSLPL